MKKITLIKDVPGCKAGTEGVFNAKTKSWEFPYKDRMFDIFDFPESDIDRFTDFFKIEEDNEIVVGDLVEVVSNRDKDGEFWRAKVGEISTVIEVEENSKKWVKCDPRLTGGNHPMSCLRKVDKANLLKNFTIKNYSPVVVYETGTTTRKGILFGCNYHSIEDLNSYYHFLTENSTAKMVVEDIELTFDMINKLILFYNINKPK